MKIKNLLFTVVLILFHAAVFAQGRVIKGVIKDSKSNEGLPGVAILVSGTSTATTSDVNGAYSITVEGEGKKLVFSYVGYVIQTVSADKDVIDVALVFDATLLKETVVTALGVSREKKSLGYATQQLSGDQLTGVKSGNFVNQISGKVAGARVKNSYNMGGSTNIIIRGATSIVSNNQALFVIDGVPMNNDVTNGSSQASGRSGFDYGSPISDLNPDDIESINVLKGAAATALYGSRAARGVIIITTKKGKAVTDTKRRFGVTLNSNVTVGMVDKSTFPTYQQEYGAGYGPYYGGGPGGFFLLEDIKGDGTADDIVVPYTEDASMGGKFDPNLMVYQWDAFVPQSPNYKKATPWVAAGDNGPISFFNKSMSTTNGFAINGGSETGSFRVSYANSLENGIMPNSKLKKNNFEFNGGLALNDKFSANVSANFTNSQAVGRNETGYNDNNMTSFRQWMETNVNYPELKDIYDLTKTNYGWNPASSSDPGTPIYWNNPYFQRFENYESDSRNRFFGNVGLNYKINDMISLLARIGVDGYATVQEERLAVGSVPTGFGIGSVNSPSGYSRLNKNFGETNFDLMANFKKDLNENFNLSGLIGSNIRRSSDNSIYASTNGGMVVPGLYSISNSLNTPLPSTEVAKKYGVNGFFASASLGYKRFLFLDVTARQDYSSTLPVDKNAFFYPGVSGSFVFSEKLKNLTWLDFGKVRLNYANVGNDAPFASTKDVYDKPNSFGSTALFSLPNAKNNENLKPEISTTTEAGLEMVFFKKRVGFDFAYYNTNTKNQIFNVAVSTATGYSSKFVNAGKIQNKGMELSVFGSPVKTNNFEWTITLNYAANKSKVVELFEGVDNLQIASFQGGVTLNATVGEALGSLKGSDYVYLNGQKVVGTDGYYKRTTTTNNTIGNVNPKFTAGIENKLTYKNWTYSFLIDMQQGGSVWSVDMWYGLGTGLYPETVGNNDLGNPMRDPVVETSPGVYAANSGGVVLEGVQADGTPNKVRVEADDYAVWGWATNPNAGFIYDASYVKLREMTLSYRIPLKKEYFFTNASVGLVGSNLWIIHKKLPYADPEAGSGAGNIQGFQVGVMPAVRTFGFNLTLQF